LLLEGLKCRALEKGYDVYFTDRRSDDILSEIDQIIRTGQKILLFIDNYPDYLDVIRYFYINSNDLSAIILAGRTSVHDALIDSLCATLDTANIPEFAIDNLTANELAWINNCFNEYGFWAKKAAWSKQRKIDYLRFDCKGEFYAILIKLLQSPQIYKRFDLLFSQLKNKKDYYEITICILILTTLNRLSLPEDLIDIWGDQVLATQFRRNPVVMQLIDFDRGIFKMRSSIAAEFILREVVSAESVVDILSKMAGKADKAYDISSYYKNLAVALMRYSNLQYILSESQRLKSAIRYYESIKNLKMCSNNPLFWLQYAIACLVYEDFPRAKTYFDTAYSFAESKEWDTFQIDNHYARYLLANAIKNGNKSTCMSAFRKASKIINKQVKRERLHYPYRVASNYALFYDRFGAELESSEKQEIRRAAEYILQLIEHLPKNIQEIRHVADCEAAMNHVIKNIPIPSDRGR
jgi:hypothetical protein